MMGTLIIFISFRHMSMVPVARFRTEVYTRSNSNPSSFNSCPEDLASAFPLSVRPTSVHPVNRFSKFHLLSPWRSRTSLTVFINLTFNLFNLTSQSQAFLDCTSHLEYVATTVHYLNTTEWFSVFPFQMFLWVTTQGPC